MDKVYDGVVDCLTDGYDETNATKLMVATILFPEGFYFSNTHLRQSMKTLFVKNTLLIFAKEFLFPLLSRNSLLFSGSWVCDNNRKLIPLEGLCDEKTTESCLDRTDESFCDCGRGNWKCGFYECINLSFLCDGNCDCQKSCSDEDESLCSHWNNGNVSHSEYSKIDI